MCRVKGPAQAVSMASEAAQASGEACGEACGEASGSGGASGDADASVWREFRVRLAREAEASIGRVQFSHEAMPFEFHELEHSL